MTVDRVAADLATVAADRELKFPDSNRGWRATVRPLHQQTVGQMQPALLTLLGGVAVVLLITCLNVANVLLARAPDDVAIFRCGRRSARHGRGSFNRRWSRVCCYRPPAACWVWD